jgi:hypothetical protein
MDRHTEEALNASRKEYVGYPATWILYHLHNREA